MWRIKWLISPSVYNCCITAWPGEHLNEAVHAIVEGDHMMLLHIREKNFQMREILKSIETVIDELHRALILTIAMDIEGEIPHRYYPSNAQTPFDVEQRPGTSSPPVRLRRCG